MKNISDWIDNIIDDLVNPDLKLSNILLKVQVLAFKIDNKQLKDWINLELNGYAGNKIPDYREIPTLVQGNLIQQSGFNIITKNNVGIPIEYLEKELVDFLATVKLDTSVSELEKMVVEKGSYQINLPHSVCYEFSRIMKPWNVDCAWKRIGENSIEGIISTIKSTLLNFLLELNKEFGDNDNLSIMKKKDKVENIFNKTIGTIKSENVNITIGNKSSQAVNYGDKNNINNASGDNINQNLNSVFKNDLTEFLELLKSNLDKFDLGQEEREDIESETARIETQLNRETPRLNIINTALTTINGIMTGIVANAYTPIILEKLGNLITRL